MKTHGHGYHVDIDLSDRSRDLDTHWKLHWVVGEPARARYMDVMHDMD